MSSDRGDEYYDRYHELGHHSSPFPRFLEKEGIIAQYTKLETPQQNGVVERRNRTLMDIVRSTVSNTNYLIYCGVKNLRWQCIF